MQPIISVSHTPTLAPAQIDFIEKLPIEIAIIILQKLNLVDLNNVARTSKFYHQFIRENKRVFEKEKTSTLPIALEIAIKNKSPESVLFLTHNLEPITGRYTCLPLLHKLASRILKIQGNSEETKASIEIFDKNRQGNTFCGKFPILEGEKGILIEAIKLEDIELINDCLRQKKCPPITEVALEHAIKSKNFDIFKIMLHTPHSRKKNPDYIFKTICQFGSKEMIGEFFNSIHFANFNYKKLVKAVQYLVDAKKWDLLNVILNHPIALDLNLNIKFSDLKYIESEATNHSDFILSCSQTLEEVASMHTKIKPLSQADLNRALLYACIKGRVDVIEYLLTKGAELGASNYLAFSWAVMFNREVAIHFIENRKTYNIPDEVLEKCCYLTAARGNYEMLSLIFPMVLDIYKDNEEQKRTVLFNVFLEATIASTYKTNTNGEDIFKFVEENFNVVTDTHLLPLKLCVEHFNFTYNSFRMIDWYFKLIGSNKLVYNKENHYDFLSYLILYPYEDGNIEYFLKLHVFYINLGPQGPIIKKSDGSLHICNTLREIGNHLNISSSENEIINERITTLNNFANELDIIIRQICFEYSSESDVKLPTPEELMIKFSKMSQLRHLFDESSTRPYIESFEESDNE